MSFRDLILIFLNTLSSCNITARQRICRKVMFSQVSLCPQGAGYLWYQVLSGGWICPVGGGYVCLGHGHVQGVGGHVQGVGGYIQGGEYPLPGMGYNRIQSANGQYASYWNAFLLTIFSMYSPVFTFPSVHFCIFLPITLSGRSPNFTKSGIHYWIKDGIEGTKILVLCK